MKIRSYIYVTNNVYNVEFKVEDLSAYEQDMLANFGEPEVEVGGLFSGTVTRPASSVPVSVEYTLPSRQLKMVSGFPYKEVFDLRDNLDSDVQAKLYETIIRDRIQSAKLGLLSLTPNFEGETTTTI